MRKEFKRVLFSLFIVGLMLMMSGCGATKQRVETEAERQQRATM